ncbi:MAG: hypothetical protein ABI691_21835 [Ginsengibacter sp.]
MANLQEELAARKACYLEAIIRQGYIKHDRWIFDLGGDANDDKTFYNTYTVCDLLTKFPGNAAPLSLCGLPQTFTPVPAPDQTTDNGLVHAMARLELADTQPDRQDELYHWDKENMTAYWMRIILSADKGLSDLQLLEDNSDFRCMNYLRLVYLYGELPPGMNAAWLPPSRVRNDTGNIPAVVNFDTQAQQLIKEKMLTFKFWHTDQFRARKARFIQEDRKKRELQEADDVIFGTGSAEDKQAKLDKLPDLTNDDYTDYQYEMQYWSENHQIIFATTEYLCGQLWAEEVFHAGYDFRSLFQDHDNDTDVKGSAHVEIARQRILRWLNDRLKYGFSECNAPGYYEEHLTALFNLADFSLDDGIQQKACMVIDLIVFDLARFSLRGNFTVAANRAHWKHKCCGWHVSVGDVIKIWFNARTGEKEGSRWFDTRESFSEDGNSGMHLALSKRYTTPDVLMSIGQDNPENFIDRSRVSLDWSESGDYGLGFDSEEDVMTWWSRASWFQKDVVNKTIELVDNYDLASSAPFSKILPILGIGATIQLIDRSTLADRLSILTEGSAYTRSNIYTYRTRNSILSSIQHMHTGQMSFQGSSCQATLSMCATVFTSHPSAGGLNTEIFGILGGAAIGSLAGPIGIAGGAVIGGFVAGGNQIEADEDGTGGPGWWTGTVTQPRVLQMRNAAIIIYRPKFFQWTFFGSRTHAWFPKSAFDDISSINDEAPADKKTDPMLYLDFVESTNNNFDSGRWLFGCCKDGYVGLYSAQTPEWTTDGPWANRELIADGKNNVFIIQIGSKDEYGELSEFIDKVMNARIHINGIHFLSTMDTEVSYDIPRTNKQVREWGPGSDRIELHFDDDEDETRLGGQPFDDYHFPRFENIYIKGGRVLWQQYRYTIEHKEFSLSHDFTPLTDTSGSALPVHREINTGEFAPRLIEQLQCSPQQTIQGKGSTATPSLAVAGYNNFTDSFLNLYMVWKGGKDDNGLYFASFDGQSWSAQYSLGDRGSTDGPVLITVPHNDGYSSGLMMAWKGVDDDSGIYISYNDTLSWDGWIPQEGFHDIATAAKPALALFKNIIYLVWRGGGNDHGIYFRRNVNGTWLPQEKINGVGSTSSPCLVIYKERLQLYWKGAEDDSNIYFTRLKEDSDNEWEDQQLLSYKKAGHINTANAASTHGPSVIVLGEIMFICWKGIDDDSSIYMMTYENDEWTGQVKIKGIGSANAPVAGILNDQILMVWRGVDDKGFLNTGLFNEDDHSLYSLALTKDKTNGNGGIYFQWG